jgi:hypothetical protein
MMRRFVAALVVAILAASLAACGGAPTAEQVSSSALAPAPPAAVAPESAATSDSLSPTAAVLPYQQFPNDKLQTPQIVLDKLAAKQPMLMYWYDPTSLVSKDQRGEIDAVMKKYRGTIDLVTFDYTVGLKKPGASPSAALPPEVAKSELMTSLLNVHTTPYVLFVDGSGRITYRFAGYVERGLLERETLRATQ